MKNIAALLLIVTTLNLKPQTSNAQQDFASKVNPFIGTGGHGHTYPGASAPFGMVQLSPDTRLEGWDGCSGYHYSDSVIYGFSHTHLSGTGCSDYGDILLMPIVTENKFKIFDNKEYSSKFSHANESASPGYYKVKLDKFNIIAELTCTQRTGFHKYTFPKTNKATIILDLKHRDEVLDSYLKIINDSTIMGMRRSKAWAEDQYVYFYIQFSKPFKHYGIASDDKLINISESNGSSSNEAHGKNVKAFFDFDATDGKPVLVKVGISAVSEDGAHENLAAENRGWNFDKVKANARAMWNKELSKIEVHGKPEDEIIFYTALYHCFLNPNVYSDFDGKYRGTDLKIHHLRSLSLGEGRGEVWNNCYTVFSLWDTFRALHPLLSIIDQKRTNDFINTFISEYENGGILPVWELSANETFCMIGYHSVPVIVDAYLKGIKGFDAEKAFKAMKHSADTNLYGLECYRKFGFLSNDCEHESVSKTLEYAYDDWCIAQMAKALGHDADYLRFIQRAQSYKNVFDPATGFMRGKDNGMFHSPFEPAEVNNYYTEANSWQYSFYVPQDISGLMALHGGKKKFADKLDALFKADVSLKGRPQADITGLIGQYAHGNEPSHHITYLYNYADEQWNTQTQVYNICKDFYHNAPDGLCGNEDCGQMSAWYVMSSMGFYEVCPGSNQYCIGTTIFDSVKINLENGKTFSIETVNRTDNNRYIQSIQLNGKDYHNSYLMHNDLMNGGKLTFRMSDYASINKLSNNLVSPVTSIIEDQIVPAPYTDCESKVFRGKQIVSLKCIDSTATIFVRKNILADAPPQVYTAPFEINQNVTIDFFAIRLKEGSLSARIATSFLKIPEGRYITLKSKYDNQYTAGGDEALIDGVHGDTNWRKGAWQGYPGNDLEAVVDLGKSQSISKLGLGCLQDIGPWIFYPGEIIFAVSDDNINFKTVATIHPETAKENAPLQTTDFIQNVTTTGRYVKVIAKPFGKLPAWHISAGETAWLFADEILITAK
ncbi:MAG: GH92 family glycosyl hydrolase [Bacteroidia bacterium]